MMNCLIFDIETVFLYPWAVTFKKMGMFGFGEMIVFIAILLVLSFRPRGILGARAY